jgi:hypothetical protein
MVWVNILFAGLVSWCKLNCVAVIAMCEGSEHL